MNAWLLGLVGTIYCVVGAGYFRAKRLGMVLTFVGYAIANVGLILDANDI